MELRTIIERNTYINGYVQCTVVPVKLCKEYLNMATLKISFLLPIRSRAVIALLRQHIQELYTFEKGTVFIGPPYRIIIVFLCVYCQLR